MVEPTRTSSSPAPLTEPQASGYLVRHNDKIIGTFNNEDDANNALHGYEMQNNISLDDNLEVIKTL